MPLDRFLAAQDAAHEGYADALAEIRAGRKRGHWIWYVFPQLAGLGSSSMAQHYAIRDAAEAEAYLRDATLRGRLLEITNAVAAQLRSGTPLPLLMGSEIDARKLVSSMTLFGAIARRLSLADAGGDEQALAVAADEILEIAGRQGYERCRFTERHIAGSA